MLNFFLHSIIYIIGIAVIIFASVLGKQLYELHRLNNDLKANKSRRQENTKQLTYSMQNQVHPPKQVKTFDQTIDEIEKKAKS